MRRRGVAGERADGVQCERRDSWGPLNFSPFPERAESRSWSRPSAASRTYGQVAPLSWVASFEPRRTGPAGTIPHALCSPNPTVPLNPRESTSPASKTKEPTPRAAALALTDPHCHVRFAATFGWQSSIEGFPDPECLTANFVTPFGHDDTVGLLTVTAAGDLMQTNSCSSGSVERYCRSIRTFWTTARSDPSTAEPQR